MNTAFMKKDLMGTRWIRTFSAAKSLHVDWPKNHSIRYRAGTAGAVRLRGRNVEHQADRPGLITRSEHCDDQSRRILLCRHREIRSIG